MYLNEGNTDSIQQFLLFSDAIVFIAVTIFVGIFILVGYLGGLKYGPIKITKSMLISCAVLDSVIAVISPDLLIAVVPLEAISLAIGIFLAKLLLKRRPLTK